MVKNGNETFYIYGLDASYKNCPLAITSGFLVLWIFFFVTARLPRLWPWRAGIALAGGATLAVLVRVFFHQADTSAWAMKLPGARGWYMDAGGNFGRNVARIFDLVVWPAPYVAAGLAIGLMVIGAIDLRGYLVSRSDLSAESPDGTPVLPMAAGRPGFLRQVGLPVLACIMLELILWGVIHSPLGNYVRDPAAAAFVGVWFLGPLVAVIRFIQWLGMTLRPRSPTLFRRIRALLILFTVLALSAAGAWIVARIATHRPSSPREIAGGPSDSPRDRLVGKWKQNDHFAIEFRSDGTFEESSLKSENVVAPFTNRYRWTDNEHIRMRMQQFNITIDWQVEVDEFELTIVGNIEGHPAMTFRRAP